MSEMAVEVLKQQLADLTRDYTGACEAIRQLEANVAAYKARYEDVRRAVSAQNEEVCQILGKALGYPWFKDDQKNWPGATERDGVCVGDHVAESLADEAAARLTAAEAAREEDFASFVASELFAQEVRENAMEYAAKCCEGRAMGSKNTTARHEAEKCAMAIRYHARNAHLVRALDLPTPSAALQRVREEAVRQAVARADTKALERDWSITVESMPYYSTEQEFSDALRAVLLAALFPTPDAGGPA